MCPCTFSPLKLKWITLWGAVTFTKMCSLKTVKKYWFKEQNEGNKINILSGGEVSVWIPPPQYISWSEWFGVDDCGCTVCNHRNLPAPQHSCTFIYVMLCQLHTTQKNTQLTLPSHLISRIKWTWKIGDWSYLSLVHLFHRAGQVAPCCWFYYTVTQKGSTSVFFLPIFLQPGLPWARGLLLEARGQEVR